MEKKRSQVNIICTTIELIASTLFTLMLLVYENNRGNSLELIFFFVGVDFSHHKKCAMFGKAQFLACVQWDFKSMKSCVFVCAFLTSSTISISRFCRSLLFYHFHRRNQFSRANSISIRALCAYESQTM